MITDFKYWIHVNKDAIPVVHNSYRVPISLQPKLKGVLANLENSIVSKVTYPTALVNRMGSVDKWDGRLGICLDPRKLSKYTLREHFIIPNSDEIICRLKQKISVIDILNGFWQIQLTVNSCDLCTSQTSVGRYLLLPFGINSEPEVFQRKNFESFGNVKNIEVYFDDVIVADETKTEHVIEFAQVRETATRVVETFNNKL